MAGVLYVVATPIGNLGDLTHRAEQTLRDADVIAAEDTRRTRALLSYLGIKRKPIARIDANARARAVEKLVDRIEDGDSIAMVTDAGTPGVSDPGAALVRAAAERDVAVVAIPGPSAVTTAVSISGLVEGAFLFLGFLPRKGEKRKTALTEIERTRVPVVLFEAPTRARKTLGDLARGMPDRPVCITRELTKRHETISRGTLGDAVDQTATFRGEITIVLGEHEVPPDASDSGDLDDEIRRMTAEGEPARAIAATLAKRLGLARRLVYARVVELRKKAP